MGVDKPNHTQTPNLIFDDLMRYMGEAELKVTLAIVRKTFGFHRGKHKMSITTLQEITGMSRQGVINGIGAGMRRGLIERERDEKGSFLYSLSVNEVDQSASQRNGLVNEVDQRDSQRSRPLPVNEVDQSSQPDRPKMVNDVDQNTPVLKKEKETFKEREEDDLPPLPLSARAAVHAAWKQYYHEPLPAKLLTPIHGLTEECGADAVIYAIEAAVAARSRNYSYIATCARNYIPPAPEPPAPSYVVEVPGVVVMPPAPQPLPAPPAHPPLEHADPWAVCVAELRRELPGGYVGKLEGSRLEAAGSVAHNANAGPLPGVEGGELPLYRIVIAREQAESGLSYFVHQCARAIRVKLGGVLGHPVLIEIVAESITQPQEEPAHA